MTNFSQVRGRALRSTSLDGCGNPLLGPRSVVITKGFITVGLTNNTVTATEISVTNAAGEECISDSPVPKFKNKGVEIAFCGVNPDLIHQMTGQPLVLDADDNPVGFRENSKVDVSLTAFALELWTNVPGGVCDESGDVGYGYTLLPFVGGGQIGDVTYQNDAVNFTLTGAVTKDGNKWGVGPYDVTKDADGNPGPLLVALDDYDHTHIQYTNVAPPEPSDEPLALGVPATGANVTSTTKAVLAPSNSYAPTDLADASDVTATPSTAWATGKYLLLLDGTKAHWTGSAWAAGAA